MNEIINLRNNVSFDGVGGNKMSTLLVNQFYSLKDFKSIGLIEVLLSLTKYLKMISFLKKKIIQKNYDLIITIDSPDFNYPIIKRLRNKKFKQKIIHVVAPSVWAWREYRAKKFSYVYDEILVLFNFEIKYFANY